MSYTTDRNDPKLHQKVVVMGENGEKKETGQNQSYLILSEEERTKGFVRPVRQTYVHTQCGTATTMGLPLAETYARDPKFYGATYCCGCHQHFPVGEFTWDGTDEIVGS